MTVPAENYDELVFLIRDSLDKISTPVGPPGVHELLETMGTSALGRDFLVHTMVDRLSEASASLELAAIVYTILKKNDSTISDKLLEFSKQLRQKS